MTYSLNYGDLLKRQAELQRLGGMPKPTRALVKVAQFAEIGELVQTLKPDWAWWTKPGDTREVDREQMLGEAADVLHFALLDDIAADYRECLTFKIEAWEGYDLPKLIGLLEHQSRHSYRGYGVACALCGIIARYGFTPDDLARAYWEKTEENLRRWASVPQS